MFWRVLAVAVLAMTAGCGAFANASEPTPTVTPVPVPESSTQTATPTGIAPGLSGGGVTDVDRLAAGHLAVLNGSSYTWESHHRIDRFPNEAGYEYVVREELAVETNDRYSFRTNRRDVHSGEQVPFVTNVSEYADGERTYRRFVPFGAQEFTYERESVEPANQAYTNEILTPIRRYMAVPNATVAEVRRDGQRYYRVESQRAAAPGLTLGQNFSVTALVSPRGFVPWMTVSYEVDQNGRTEQRQYTFRYYLDESVTVERPAWVTERWPSDSPPRN